MKKFISVLLILALVFSVSACGKPQEIPAEKPQEQPIIEPTESPFYTKMQTDFRPIAVMIDNDEARSRPQMGLESAYIVYEMVIEGAATRFLALFNDDTLEKVGPIRSARHYFLDYAIENDARYVHAGWSEKAAAEITSRGVNNINGLFENIFWRDRTYDNSWHNLYTSLKKVSELSDKKGYKNTTETKLLNYLKLDETPNGQDATSLSIPYAPFYKVDFKYNPETKLYDRFVNGTYHMSQTGDRLTAKNIIIYSVQNVNLNDGINEKRQDLKNVGSGEGYYLSEGKAVKIKWEKSSRSAKTIYTDHNGNALNVNPGNTYIELAPSHIGYTIK